MPTFVVIWLAANVLLTLFVVALLLWRGLFSREADGRIVVRRRASA